MGKLSSKLHFAGTLDQSEKLSQSGNHRLHSALLVMLQERFMTE